MFDGLRFPHVRLVATYWLRSSLRTGGGLVGLLLVLVTGISVAGIFLSPVEAVLEKAPEVGHTRAQAARDLDRTLRSDQMAGFVGWATGQDQGEVHYLLDEQPALLSVFWLMLLLLYPFLTCVCTFNQTAGDIGSRGLRYLLLRTERPNVLLGRLLGSGVFVAISTFFVALIVVLYIGIKLNVYGLGAMVLWTLQGYLAVMLVALPYAALCAWISSLLESAFAALALCLLATGAPVLVVRLVHGATRLDVDWLLRVVPWGWRYDLLSHDMGTRLLAYAMMLVFTVLFGLLGLRAFSKRDL
jgi:hypothetical protein